MIPRQAILDYLDGKSEVPILPNEILLKAPGLKDSIPDYEGFESIGFRDQIVYLTIESGNDQAMMGYLVSGTISADLQEITLDLSHVVGIEPGIQMDNRTDESVIVTQNKIFTFFEVNGAELNPHPAAHVFSLDLTPQGTVSFPNLEYRVTDAALGPNGEIWVINKLSPDEADLFTESDPLVGKGNESGEAHQVERLVELDLSGTGLTLSKTSPLRIALDKDSRNWEGLALLEDRGFLVVTDEHPDTILGFIPLPK